MAYYQHVIMPFSTGRVRIQKKSGLSHIRTQGNGIKCQCIFSTSHQIIYHSSLLSYIGEHIIVSSIVCTAFYVVHTHQMHKISICNEKHSTTHKLFIYLTMHCVGYDRCEIACVATAADDDDDATIAVYIRASA